jgi:hypothetical protein
MNRNEKDPVFCTYILNHHAKNAQRHAERWRRLRYFIRAEECMEEAKELYMLKAISLNGLLAEQRVWPVATTASTFASNYHDAPVALAGKSKATDGLIGFHLPRKALYEKLPPARNVTIRGLYIPPVKYPQGYSLDEAKKFLRAMFF